MFKVGDKVQVVKNWRGTSLHNATGVVDEVIVSTMSRTVCIKAYWSTPCGEKMYIKVKARDCKLLSKFRKGYAKWIKEVEDNTQCQHSN